MESVRTKKIIKFKENVVEHSTISNLELSIEKVSNF